MLYFSLTRVKQSHHSELLLCVNIIDHCIWFNITSAPLLAISHWKLISNLSFSVSRRSAPSIHSLLESLVHWVTLLKMHWLSLWKRISFCYFQLTSQEWTSLGPFVWHHQSSIGSCQPPSPAASLRNCFLCFLIQEIISHGNNFSRVSQLGFPLPWRDIMTKATLIKDTI